MRFVLVILALALTLAGCAVKPKALDDQSMKTISTDLKARAYANQESLPKSITLYDAMARALKYNLDLQIELMEEALKAREYDVARAEMLPSLIGNAAYRGRNSFSGGRSFNLDTRQVSAGSATVSSPKHQLTSDLALSWDILDFGVSYYRAKQVGNTRLIAEERKRKVANRLMEDVRTAYWRSVSAEHLVSGLKALARKTEKALREARDLEKSGQASPLAALTFQRELIDIKSEIENLEESISVAKTQLLALMNLPPGTNVKLNHTRQTASGLKIRQSADDLIEAALTHRSELREIVYDLRSNKIELNKAVLEVLPSAKLFLGQNVDANRLLFNQNWLGWGSTVSANLMNVFKLPGRRAQIKANRSLLDRRALALTVAIVTQVYVAQARFGNAKKKFLTSSERVSVQTKIRKQIRAAVQAGTASNQTLIREEMNTLVSRAKRDIAYSDMQNTYANIYASIGVDPFNSGIDRSESVAVISEKLEQFWRERGDLSDAVAKKRTKKKKNVRAGKQKKSQPAKSSSSTNGSNEQKTSDLKSSSTEQVPPAVSASPTTSGPAASSASFTTGTVAVPRSRPAVMYGNAIGKPVQIKRAVVKLPNPAPKPSPTNRKLSGKPVDLSAVDRSNKQMPVAKRRMTRVVAVVRPISVESLDELPVSTGERKIKVKVPVFNKPVAKKKIRKTKKRPRRKAAKKTTAPLNLGDLRS